MLCLRAMSSITAGVTVVLRMLARPSASGMKIHLAGSARATIDILEGLTQICLTSHPKV